MVQMSTAHSSAAAAAAGTVVQHNVQGGDGVAVVEPSSGTTAGGAEAGAAVMDAVSSECVRSVLQATIAKLALVSVLTTDTRSQAEELSRSVGEEISRVMQEQKAMEQRFEQLVALRSVLKTMPNKAKFNENQQQLHEVAEQLRASTQHLCRNLKDNPSVADNMLKNQTVRSSLQALLSTTVAELQMRGAYTSLEEYVREEHAREVTEQRTIANEKAASAQVKVLRQRVLTEMEEHEHAMRLHNKSLATLKEELKELKLKTATETTTRHKDAAARLECMRRLHAMRLTTLRSELQLLHSQLAMEQQVHSASAAFLTRTTHQLQAESVRWSGKHEVDTAAKDHQLEVLKSNHQKDLLLLQEMEVQYRQALAEKELRDSAHANQEEHLLMAHADEERRTRCAVKIQSLYRGWKVRADTKGKKKGKTKGKKKGKK